MGDVIQILEERRRRYNAAIDRAIQALRESPPAKAEADGEQTKKAAAQRPARATRSKRTCG